MANRKQELDAAIDTSKQMAAIDAGPSAAPVTPAQMSRVGGPVAKGTPVGPKTASQTRAQKHLSEFQLPWSKREQEGSDAPVIEKRAKLNTEVIAMRNTIRSKDEVNSAMGRRDEAKKTRERDIKTNRAIQDDPQTKIKADKAAAKFLNKPKPKKQTSVLKVSQGPRKKK